MEKPVKMTKRLSKHRKMWALCVRFGLLHMWHECGMWRAVKTMRSDLRQAVR